ncbi:MAG: hypothetical protein H0X30_28370 [Anaerolineae bacterium]|nr:hypothetical protein [Anaerolineae bacterium]
MSYKTKREQELIQQIESAFVDSVRPSDDELIVNPEYDKADKFIQDFKGKTWQDVTLEILYRRRLQLPLFTAQAFRYFLPAFLIAPLRPSSDSKYNSDEISEHVFYSLISPAGKFIWTLKLKDIISGLSAKQKLAVTSFIQYFLENNPQIAALYADQVKSFWSI